MPTFDELIVAACQSERVRARQLAKRLCLSEYEALRQTLEKVAAGRPLAEFITTRAADRSHAEQVLSLRRRDKLAALARKRAARQPDASAWRAWFDGATRPNPGCMGIGGVLKGPDGQIVQISHAAGQGDSSEAEYLALIAVLEAALPFRPARLLVYGDSQVVINDAKGVCKIVAPTLQAYSKRAALLVSQLESVTLTWLPRARNAEADALSQQALER